MKFVEHIEPQEMPDGALEMVPVPLPNLLTVKAWLMTSNCAVTLRAVDIDTLQVVPEVESHPDQLINVLLVSGAAVRITDASAEKLDEQLEPHVMPAGLLLTTPDPMPALVTVSA